MCNYYLITKNMHTMSLLTFGCHGVILTVYLDYHRFMNKWFGFWRWTLIFCLIFQVSMTDGSFVIRNANFDISSFDNFFLCFCFVQQNESAIFSRSDKTFQTNYGPKTPQLIAQMSTIMAITLWSSVWFELFLTKNLSFDLCRLQFKDI